MFIDISNFADGVLANHSPKQPFEEAATGAQAVAANKDRDWDFTGFNKPRAAADLRPAM
ncbi:MAG: hypothetical protein H6868_02475 [Rhodospirillales bacterium]|nr:hypothetical protein [Rhodospirillales bacterium]